MAGSTRAELASSSLDGSNFGSSYPNVQRGTYSSSTLDRSGSFRESMENRMMVSGPVASRNSAPPVEILPASQYLALETFSTNDLKNVRSGELRRVLGISVEDHSSVSSQSKLLPPVSWEELKRFRGSLEETSSRASDRGKTLQDCIQKLDKFRNIVTKKRQRSEIHLNDKTGSSGLLKIGSQMHQNTSDIAGQRPDERTKNGVPNKRIRSSMADVRASSPYSIQSDGRNTLPVRQSTMIDKDKNILVDKDKSMLRACNGVPVSNDEKIYGLPAGGEGWEKKMKRKRSVGTMANRTADGDRELKQSTQQRPNNEPRPRTADGLGFRIGSSNGIKMDTTSGCNSRIVPRNDLSNGSLSSDRRERSSVLSKERATAKGSNRPNICEDAQLGSQSPLTKRKASRSPRTSSNVVINTPNFPRSSGGIDGWEQPSGLNKVQPMTGTINNKRSVPTGSSSPPVGKWGGQRSQKFSRSRRANVVSPVSNFDEAQGLSEGIVVPDLGARLSTAEPSGVILNKGLPNNSHLKLKIETVPSPAGLSETEESGILENKCKEKGTDYVENEIETLNATHKAASFVLPSKKNKVPPREEIGDGVRRQGRSGRGSMQSKACLQLSKEKLETIESNKPFKSGRLISDKTERSGRPSKKVADRKGCTRPMQLINNIPSELHGESDDDREELLAVVKDVRDISRFGKFWQRMEPIFGLLSSDDFNFVKNQINFAKEFDGCFTNLLSDDNHNEDAAPSHISQQVSRANVVGLNRTIGPMCSNEEPKSVKILPDRIKVERWFEKVIPISQRLLSAFISEEETDMLDKDIKEGDTSLQFTSDCSPFGTNSFVTKFGLELENDLGSQTNCYAENTPCNGFVSTTFRSSSNFISGEELMQGNDELGFPDNPDSGAASKQGGCMGTSVTDASPYECQFEQMSLDDKVLMELQSIGIYPEAVPDLAEGDDNELDKTFSELKISLYQQVRKKKSQLCKLEKAIQQQKDYDKMNLERLAMEKLVVRAYKKLLGGRSHGSSHRTGASKISKQAAMAFAKRTLARYRTFLETGENCFSEPFLRDVLLSEPLRESDPRHVDGITSRVACNKNVESHHCQSGPRVSAYGAPSNMVGKYGPGRKSERSELDLSQGAAQLSEQTFVRSDPISNRGKKREVLLDDVANSTLPTGAKWKKTDKDHNRDTVTKNSAPKGGRPQSSTGRGERKTKSKPKQKIAQLSTSGNGLGRVIETTSFVSHSIRDSGEPFNTGSTRVVNQEIDMASTHNNALDLPKETEDTIFTSLPLHGLDSIDELDVGQGQDLGSWLNVDVDDDALQDNDDLVGLEIPMDDLSELKLNF